MEEEYYSYIKKFFNRWAFIYDIHPVVKFLSGVMDKVVDFANAVDGSRILDVATGT